MGFWHEVIVAQNTGPDEERHQRQVLAGDKWKNARALAVILPTMACVRQAMMRATPSVEGQQQQAQRYAAPAPAEVFDEARTGYGCF
ncbi:hypothetical protein DDQ68_00040 [Hymenobacter nivis]|uniref:Uncharacterized protein n=1 Tax=Hymenobacter nivis TaxID=1850093 RepID=A0A2Z3GD13_9BACT|nr:hypothetical protein DDQ68_00040 [Hymenobacter nivis]